MSDRCGQTTKGTLLLDLPHLALCDFEIRYVYERDYRVGGRGVLLGVSDGVDAQPAHGNFGVIRGSVSHVHVDHVFAIERSAHDIRQLPVGRKWLVSVEFETAHAE